MISFRAFSGQQKDVTPPGPASIRVSNYAKSALNNGLNRFTAQFARIRTPIRDFRLSTRGNVAVLSAVLALPMVSAVGCVVDYSMATMVRVKLQAAADAATLTTVSSNSPITTAAKNMSGSGTVAGGSTYALNFLNADLTDIGGYTNLSTTATVTKTGNSVTATVSFTANVPTFFMGVVGYRNVSVSGSSTASYGVPSYIDFYLMIDVSGSMSFPSTAAEQTRLEAVNPDNYGNYPTGCTFACHFTAQGACAQAQQGSIPAVGARYGSSNWQPNPSPGGYCQGFTISRLGTTPASGSLTGNNVNWTGTQVSTCPTAGTTSCIQLRADAVGYAVNQLLSTAASSQVVTNQYRVGLYPFIEYLPTSCSSFPPCFGLTTNLTGSPTSPGTINYAAANLATVLDTGNNVSLGSGGTHFENAFPSMNTLISSVGTGASPSSTLPYVFVITDGSQDYQTYWSGNWSGTGGSPYQNSATTVPTSLCTTLKNRGITIAVLYIPYETISPSNPNFANNEDGYANANIPNIPAALQVCASPNFYYTATTPAAITTALQQMFAQAVSTAHISN
jgi:Flp pilus assembly protein TadG